MHNRDAREDVERESRRVAGARRGNNKNTNGSRFRFSGKFNFRFAEASEGNTQFDYLGSGALLKKFLKFALKKKSEK